MIPLKKKFNSTESLIMNFNIHIIKDLGHPDSLGGFGVTMQAGRQALLGNQLVLSSSNKQILFFIVSSPQEPQVFPSSFEFSVPVLLHYPDRGFLQRFGQWYIWLTC